HSTVEICLLYTVTQKQLRPAETVHSLSPRRRVSFLLLIFYAPYVVEASLITHIEAYTGQGPPHIQWHGIILRREISNPFRVHVLGSRTSSSLKLDLYPSAYRTIAFDSTRIPVHFVGVSILMPLGLGNRRLREWA
ncbi:NADP oxidoreductase coenzyme F420-dependent, partial [Striga asiatica]